MRHEIPAHQIQYDAVTRKRVKKVLPTHKRERSWKM